MAGSQALPGAFDALAADYDASFSHTALGRMLRARVWAVMARHFRPGDRVLELACGTGEDALWLAARGGRVVAMDGSAEMVRIVTDKVRRGGHDAAVTALQLTFQELAGGEGPAGALEPGFDGVLSNFGGLNTIDDWRPLARTLAAVTRPGGAAVLVPMGPFCPWEVAWHLLHLRPRQAFRRWRGASEAGIGPARIPVSYPSAGRLRRDFAPWFRPRGVESLGLWLPPSYLSHLIERWPAPFAALARLEAATARLTAGWGDHYILVLERTEATAGGD